jgi:hypothetical protein
MSITRQRYLGIFTSAPDFGAFFLKNTANLRIFILVFDLPSAIGQGHIGLNLNWLQFKFSADDLESQVRCRLGDSLRASS